MRFSCDSYAVFSYETDENGRKISATELRHEADRTITSEEDAWHVGNKAAHHRAAAIADCRSVLFEVWMLDSTRPAMAMYTREVREGRVRGAKISL